MHLLLLFKYSYIFGGFLDLLVSFTFFQGWICVRVKLKQNQMQNVEAVAPQFPSIVIIIFVKKNESFEISCFLLITKILPFNSLILAWFTIMNWLEHSCFLFVHYIINKSWLGIFQDWGRGKRQKWCFRIGILA